MQDIIDKNGIMGPILSLIKTHNYREPQITQDISDLIRKNYHKLTGKELTLEQYITEDVFDLPVIKFFINLDTDEEIYTKFKNKFNDTSLIKSMNQVYQIPLTNQVQNLIIKVLQSYISSDNLLLMLSNNWDDDIHNSRRKIGTELYNDCAEGNLSEDNFDSILKILSFATNETQDKQVLNYVSEYLKLFSKVDDPKGLSKEMISLLNDSFRKKHW